MQYSRQISIFLICTTTYPTWTFVRTYENYENCSVQDLVQIDEEFVNCTSRLPLNYYFEEGQLNICKYIESRIDNCTESHARCFTTEEILQLKIDLIESFLKTIQKIHNGSRRHFVEEILDCPTYQKNINDRKQNNVQLNTFVGLWPCPRQDDTVEHAAEYNFCKMLLKENFHAKMKQNGKKSSDYLSTEICELREEIISKCLPKYSHWQCWKKDISRDLQNISSSYNVDYNCEPAYEKEWFITTTVLSVLLLLVFFYCLCKDFIFGCITRHNLCCKDCINH